MSDVPGVGAGRAAAVAAPIILMIVVSLFGLAYLVSALLGLPISFNPPLVVRVFGGVAVVAGLGVAGWTFVYRSPADMVVSTYITFTKLFKRTPISELSGRTEPLVIKGAQAYVRNPLYFGVVMMTFGWALVGGYTSVLVAGVFVLVWFWFLIPFEERELRALFGDQYKRYAEEVPMLFPFTKRRRPTPQD